MTSVNQKELFARFKCAPPASPDSITQCQTDLGFPPPADYVQLLLQMNGGEGFIGKHYLMLWPVERVIEMNANTYFAEAAPGLILFGSDGGGEAFAFDTRSIPAPVVVVPFVGMDLRVAKLIAPNFSSFMQFLYRSDDLF